MIANQFRYLLLAIHRYTRFPVPRRVRQWASPAGFDTHRAVRFLPVAGLIAGLYSAIIYLLFVQLLPHGVATLAAIIFGMLITGGRQEARLGRFFEGRADRGFAPLRYASITLAAPGVLILLLVVLLRAETLSSMDPSWLSVALLTAQPLSYGIAALAAIGESNRIHPVSGWAAVGDRLTALTVALLPLAVAIWWFDQHLAFSFAIVPALWFGAWLRHRLRQRMRALAARSATDAARRSVIGDGTGAMQQVSELAYHLGLLAWWTLIESDANGDDMPDDAEIENNDEEPSDYID